MVWVRFWSYILYAALENWELWKQACNSSNWHHWKKPSKKSGLLCCLERSFFQKNQNNNSSVTIFVRQNCYETRSQVLKIFKHLRRVSLLSVRESCIAHLRTSVWIFGVLRMVLSENFRDKKSGDVILFSQKKCGPFSFCPSHTLLNFNSNWISKN